MWKKLGLTRAARVKRIVILANSDMLSERCVAGREWRDGKAGPWIRPVSARENHAVSWEERRYRNGAEPRLLDIVDVPLLAPRPMNHQQENWLLDSKRCWKRVGTVSWDDVYRLCDPVTPLWIDGDSTYYWRNDRVRSNQVSSLTDSLRLVHVDNLKLKVEDSYGKRRVRGRFSYGKLEYQLSVTDPVSKRAYLAKDDGLYTVGDSYLTISLAREPYREFYYKLIAAIIQDDPKLTL